MGRKNTNTEEYDASSEIFLPAKSTFNGEVRSEGNIRIEGCVDGNVISENGNILFGETSNTTGNIRGIDVAVAGTINGDIEVSGQLTVCSGANVIGTVKAAAIVIEDNALFDGKLTIKPSIPLILKDPIHKEPINEHTGENSMNIYQQEKYQQIEEFYQDED